MSDPPDAERLLHKTVLVNAPVEDVWWAWTTDAGIRSWLLDDSRIELRVGGPYEWYFDDGQPGLRGSEGCEVLGFQAPTMLTPGTRHPAPGTRGSGRRPAWLVRPQRPPSSPRARCR